MSRSIPQTHTSLRWRCWRLAQEKAERRAHAPRRYRKLAWERDGFATPRAWKENARLAEALMGSADGATKLFRVQFESHYGSRREETPVRPGQTINEARSAMGLKPLAGCYVTLERYMLGIRAIDIAASREELTALVG